MGDSGRPDPLHGLRHRVEQQPVDVTGEAARLPHRLRTGDRDRLHEAGGEPAAHKPVPQVRHRRRRELDRASAQVEDVGDQCRRQHLHRDRVGVDGQRHTPGPSPQRSHDLAAGGDVDLPRQPPSRHRDADVVHSRPGQGERLVHRLRGVDLDDHRREGIGPR